MTPQAGDFAVIRTHGTAGAAIRFATRSHYNHAALFLGGGLIIEAQPAGARIRPWADYDGADVLLSTGVAALELSDTQGADAAAAGNHLVGTPYGWSTILSIGLLQYGIRPRALRRHVTNDPDLICSTLVDKIRLRAGSHLFDDNRIAQDVTPGDLAGIILAGQGR